MRLSGIAWARMRGRQIGGRTLKRCCIGQRALVLPAYSMACLTLLLWGKSFMTRVPRRARALRCSDSNVLLIIGIYLLLHGRV